MLPIKVVSIVEARTVTGPVKPLLMFSKSARAVAGGQPAISHSLMTTIRGTAANCPHKTALELAAESIDLPVERIYEHSAFDPTVLHQMGRYISSVRPDVIETHDFKSHFLLYLMLRKVRRLNAKWIAYHHGYTRMSVRVRAYQQLDRFSLRKADQILTVCKPFVEQLADRGVPRSKIHVITNALEERPVPTIEALTALRQSIGIDPSAAVILSVGRLSPEKGLDDLFKAFRQLRTGAAGVRAKLLIVGDGGERERLTLMAREFGAQVLFLGHQEDTWPYYFLASVFVLPSHSEGSPLVLFEAMAAGCAIVASAVGGIPEVIDNRCAVLIAARDYRALARSIERVLVDDSLRGSLGAVARESVRRFSPASYCRRLLDIYSKVLAGNNSSGLSDALW